MLTRLRPLRPISSPCVTYFRRFWRILPRTICLNRDKSCSILMAPSSSPAAASALLRVSAGKNTGHVIQYVRGAFIVVTVVADQAVLHHVDLGLGVRVDDLGDQAGQLDGVFL